MLAKCFLMPGFDPPHNLCIVLFSGYGNEQSPIPPSNIWSGCLRGFICMCAPVHTQGWIPGLAIQAAQGRSARGVEEGPWTSNIDSRQQGTNVVTMQNIHSIPVVLDLPTSVAL